MFMPTYLMLAMLAVLAVLALVPTTARPTVLSTVECGAHAHLKLQFALKPFFSSDDLF